MHREHMEAAAKMYKVQQRLKELGLFGAYAAPRSGRRRLAAGITIEQAFDAYVGRHADDDPEYLMAALHKAQGSRPVVLVFADSPLGQL